MNKGGPPLGAGMSSAMRPSTQPSSDLSTYSPGLRDKTWPPMMKPRSGRLSKLLQSAATLSLSTSSRTRRAGPASSDVPVSRAAWQPDPQMFMDSPLKAISCMATCQKPGLATGTHESGPAMCSSRRSPKRTSLSSSLSSSAKNTEKRPRRRRPSFTSASTREKPCSSDSRGRARPRMPSKGTSLKGSSLSLVAEMKFMSAHMKPRQTASLAKWPDTWPVPKVMVTESGDLPRAAAAAAAARSRGGPSADATAL
mmetsp:Transcript_80709/g.210527  ORF Transcript_80709/g.210527 Transcript_80709/m.210527 type:complete len:254 (+) Transcript_80709:425-1186(+)